MLLKMLESKAKRSAILTGAGSVLSLAGPSTPPKVYIFQARSPESAIREAFNTSLSNANATKGRNR